MDEEQRFAFDTWGFLTVEDAITPEQVADLKATVDAKGPDLHSQHADRGGFWSQAFVDLLDVPVISEILAEIYGGQRLVEFPPFRIVLEAEQVEQPVQGFGIRRRFQVTDDARLEAAFLKQRQGLPGL